MTALPKPVQDQAQKETNAVQTELSAALLAPAGNGDSGGSSDGNDASQRSEAFVGERRAMHL